MKLKTKLLYMAAFLMLIVPLMLTGNASAVVYNPDGAVLNGTTGLWELPDLTAIEGCFDGTTTINPAATRFDCRNVAVPSLTTASTCAATGVTPTGWNATASVARWSGCSEGGYTVNSTDPATDCVLAGGGTTNVFTRCNRAPQGADCTTLPGYTFVSAGSDAASYTCKTTGMTVPQCTAFAATTGLGYNVLGSAGVSGATVTCSIYMADATGCTAVGGTMSTTNTDETRGYCGGNWVFKAGTTGDWGSSVRNNCVKCHNPAYMDGAIPNPAGAVAKYVNASHKNASRKIVPGKALANVWIDTNGDEQFGIFPYLPGLNSPQTDSTVSPNFNIRQVDWVNGKIEDTTADGTGKGLRNLPTGVYTEWYWEFGYYGEDPERGVYNAGVGSNGKPSAKQQACFACHGTNYEGSATVDVTKEPAKSFPGIHWNGTATYTVGSRPGVVNFIGAMTDRTTNVKTTTTYGKWDDYGVLCSRCHNAAGGSHTSGGTGAANPTTAYTVNAVCGQCHVRAGSGDYAVTAGTGNLTARAQVGTGHPNYHETDFLNSPHARFTGTYGQITSSANYSSTFMTTAAGCVGCHNPHGSVREPLHELALGDAAPLEGIEEACADCHTAKADLTKMNHPVSASTPADTPDACATCHMPNGRHLFRITTDTNYTTTQPTAFAPKPDGTFAEAVWVDLKSACGQCHDSGVGIPHFTRKEQALYAKNIHNSRPTASFSWKKSTTATLTVDFTAAGCPVGDTCTYAWTFGDGGTDTGETPSHQYANGNAYTVTLTITDVTTGGTSSPYAKSVKASAKNSKPTACNAVSVVGYDVTVTDCSADDFTLPSNAVTVKWGSSLIANSVGDNLDVFTKTYSRAGTYIIRMIVTDAGGKKDSINYKVSVPLKYSVSGHVYRLDGTTPVVGASVRLKSGSQVVKMAATDAAGAYTLNNVSPGSYTVEAVKYGLTFSSTPSAVVTNANVDAADITANR